MGLMPLTFAMNARVDSSIVFATQRILDQFLERAFPFAKKPTKQDEHEETMSDTSKTVAREDRGVGDRESSQVHQQTQTEEGDEQPSRLSEKRAKFFMGQPIVEVTFPPRVILIGRASMPFRILFLRTLTALLHFDRHTPLCINLLGLGYLREKERDALVYAFDREMRKRILAAFLPVRSSSFPLL